jgi:hypothetical protein
MPWGEQSAVRIVISPEVSPLPCAFKAQLAQGNTLNGPQPCGLRSWTAR